MLLTSFFLHKIHMASEQTRVGSRAQMGNRHHGVISL